MIYNDYQRGEGRGRGRSGTEAYLASTPPRTTTPSTPNVGQLMVSTGTGVEGNQRIGQLKLQMANTGLLYCKSSQDRSAPI